MGSGGCQPHHVQQRPSADGDDVGVAVHVEPLHQRLDLGDVEEGILGPLPPLDYDRGRQELLSLKINKAVVDPADTEMLEDLIVAAINGARQQSDELAKTEMSRLTAGMPLPPGLF